MRNLILLAAALTTLSATSALAQQGPASPSRSSVIVNGATADESSRIEVVRGNMQDQLNKFISGQQIIINQVNLAIDTSTRAVQNLCTLYYQTVSVMPGVTISVPVSVPAPGVNLPPNQVINYCNSVLLIQTAPVVTNPVTTVPFTTVHVPPVCDPQTQDLAWRGSQWECVTTRPAICSGPGTTPPAWVATN